MKIKFLGTAAAEGIPALFCDCEICERVRGLGGKNIRTRSQALINDDLLIDFPADTYLHVLNYGLELHKINNCIITHNHSDHFYPADFRMRAPGFANLKDNAPFNVYGNNKVCETLLSDNMISDMVRKHKCFTVNEVKAFEEFTVAEYKITPLKADHGAENTLMYLIERDGKALLYAHDTGIFPEETWKWLEGNLPHIDFATFDCCYGLAPCNENHMGFDAVLLVVNRLKDIGVTDEKTILCVNHFSHNYEAIYDDMKKHSEKYGIITSYDGMEAEF